MYDAQQGINQQRGHAVRTQTISVEVECPDCGYVNYETVDALVGSGMVPEAIDRCAACSRMFKVSAVLELDVSALEDDNAV